MDSGRSGEWRHVTDTKYPMEQDNEHIAVKELRLRQEARELDAARSMAIAKNGREQCVKRAAAQTNSKAIYGNSRLPKRN